MQERCARKNSAYDSAILGRSFEPPAEGVEASQPGSATAATVQHNRL